MKISISILIIIAICMGFTSCKKNPPEKMSKEVFSRLYAHLMLTSTTYPATTDSLAHIRRQKIDSLFTASGTTEKDFRYAVSFYHNTPEEWKEILRMAGQELDSLRVRSK
ncbi:MAG: hypothetical protein ABSB78_04850 [Bacteroidota bacterium]